MRAAAAQTAGTGAFADASGYDYLAPSSVDSGRPPKRLSFAERRALDMENQELERGLLLWPDADMIEERNADPPSRHNSKTADWRSKRSAASHWKV